MKKSKKVFKPCCEDYEYVSDDLLEEHDFEAERIQMLSHILKYYPKVFWEAYGDGVND